MFLRIPRVVTASLWIFFGFHHRDSKAVTHYYSCFNDNLETSLAEFAKFATIKNIIHRGVSSDIVKRRKETTK